MEVLLLSKPCQTTLQLVGKENVAAGQAGSTLQTMAVLQAYQSDLLKDLDQTQGLSPEVVVELLCTTDLVFQATKQTGVPSFPQWQRW